MVYVELRASLAYEILPEFVMLFSTHGITLSSMAIWAIADLHLSFSVPEKKMDVFGPVWEGYAEKIHAGWEACVSPEDLVLVAGDLTWAMTLDQAKIDLAWLGELPGTKVLIKGNHDYWWHSVSKVRGVLPPSCHVIQNDAFHWNDVSVAGARLWDTNEYNFNAYIDFVPREEGKMRPLQEEERDSERIFQRELGRLETSLKALSPRAKVRLAMTHYPPISADLKDSRVSALLEKYRVSACVFGHLHNVRRQEGLFGEKNGVFYALTACDFLDFSPLPLT